MNEKLKGPNKNAAARLREFYNNVIRKPLTEEDKVELRKIFNKKDQNKKAAKPDQDAGQDR